MKKICTLIIGMFLFQFSFAQVEFDISDVSGNVGENVTIDVRVSNFVDIAALQFSINWDANVMEYVSIENITDQLPQFGISFFGTPDQPSIDEGELAVTWNLTSTEGITIDEQNHLMFSLVCKLTGDPGDDSPVSLSNSPRTIEFIDGDGNEVSTTSNDGSAQINGGTNTDIQFFVGSDNVMVGENFCIPVTANNFADVSFAQIPIQYNENIISYTGIQNEYFSAEAVSVPNNATGTFRYIVQDPTLENPLTMPNGETLFEICFTAIGASGTSSPVEIEDILDVPPNFFTQVIDSEGDIIDFTTDNGLVVIQGGSNDITFYFDDIDLELGQNTCIPVRTRNFSNIQSFQYAMEYETSKMSFTGVQNLNTTLPLTEGAFNEQQLGAIRVSWFDGSGVGKAVTNETILFELCFDVSGDCDQSTVVEFTDNIPNGIEITDAQNNILPFVFEPGNVNIVCSCAVSLIASQSSPATCNGDEDGTITVEADGGNGNYTYMWDNGDMGATTTDGAGIYTVSVSDGENCNVEMTFTISEPDALTVMGSVTNETTTCNGTISLDVDGGNGGYQYAWSDPNSVNSPDRTDLCKGDYTVTVTDSKGCSQIAAYSVAPKALQIVDFEITNVSCNGGSDGSIDLTIEGGCPDYTIIWSEGNGENLPAGNYMVTITDASTPVNEITAMYPVTEPTAITITNPVIVNADMNNMNGSIDVDVAGGTPNYSYLWTPSGQITEDLVNVPAGKYSLQVTDDNDCVVSSEEYCIGSSVIVINWEDPNAEDGLYNGFGVACNGDCNGVLDGEVVAANGNITYTINEQDYASLPITDLCSGMYTVDFADEAGLVGSFNFEIIAPDAISGEVTLISECAKENDGQASVVAIGGTGEYTYQWVGTTQITPDVTDLVAGPVSVVITDQNGCQFMAANATDLAECDVPVDSACYIGRAIITPNEDGANDVFIISCLENTNNILRVFDRFGRTVYEQANYDNTWSGLNTQGAELPENGYMWVLEVVSTEGIREVHKGTVTILRNEF